jgi:hypothetical protein
MARILPERTVEAWSTAYIMRWFPTALLWAPTQGDPLNWDAAVALPNYRYFVLEYKAVEGGSGQPYVPIDTAQLYTYSAINRTFAAPLVWYVLPYWKEMVDPGQFLPSAAHYRTIQSNDPAGLGPQPPGPGFPPVPRRRRTEYALARGCETYFYVAEPTAMLAHAKLDTTKQFPRLPVEDVPDVAVGVTLEHFLHLVVAHKRGLPWSDLQERVDNPIGQARPGPTLTAYGVPAA